MLELPNIVGGWSTLAEIFKEINRFYLLTIFILHSSFIPNPAFERLPCGRYISAAFWAS